MLRFRKFNTLNDFLVNLHNDGFGIIEYQGDTVPCIYVKKSTYDQILSKSLGKKYVIDTLLNIFYDGSYVFVDIQLNFINLGIEENFLIHANTASDFFKYLSRSGLLTIVPKTTTAYEPSNVFMIQLPNKERISRAVSIIESNIQDSKKNDRNEFERKKK